jgi:hypothetical protein
MFLDEGRISKVYNIYEELFKKVLGFREYDPRLTLVYGDMRTTAFIRGTQNDQLGASDPWEQRKWMLPVPGYFHIEMNYIEMLFRVFWDTGDKTIRSSAIISNDVYNFHRGRHIKKSDIKIHQVFPMLLHGLSARISAFLIEALVDAGELDPDDLHVEAVFQALKKMKKEVREEVLDDVQKTVFSYEGWTGRDRDVAEEDIDTEFRSHCRLMQCVETILIFHQAVREGDYSILHDIISQLPVLFWGGRSPNYGPEMLYFSWLLSPEVTLDDGLRDAILKGGLVRCATSGSKYNSSIWLWSM